MTYSHFDFCGDRVDSRELRRALGRFPTGVTVITGHSPDTGRTEGMTANSFAAVSLSPALVLWSIRVDAPSFRTFNSAPAFAINVLAAEQGWLAKKFATPAANKFSGVDHHIGFGQCPVLDGSLAIFECETHARVLGGDHVILIGRIVKASYRDGAPLVFNAGRFCDVSERPEPIA